MAKAAAGIKDGLKQPLVVIQDGVEQWFRVCLNTIVRAGEKLDSERLRILPMGSRVCVVAVSPKNPRRVEISKPIKGWCSVSSSNGDTILAKIDDPNEVPQTPKNSGDKVKNLKERAAAAKTAAASASDEKYKEQLTNNAKILELRAEEAEIQRQQEEITKQEIENYSTSKPSAPVPGENDKDYNGFGLKDIVFLGTGEIGVVRWRGKHDSFNKEPYLGIEVQSGTGDSDGTVKDSFGNAQQLFPVPEKSAIFVKVTDVKKRIRALKLLELLESKTNEVAAVTLRLDKAMAYFRQNNITLAGVTSETGAD